MVGHPASHPAARPGWYSGVPTRRPDRSDDGALTLSGAAFQPLPPPGRPPAGSPGGLPLTHPQPGTARPPAGVWRPRLDCVPVRSPLLRTSRLLSRAGYSDVSLPRFDSTAPSRGRHGACAVGFPHSVTLGSSPATRLPEAFRGVPRPSSSHGPRGIPRVLCLQFPLKLSTSALVGRGGFEPPPSRLSGGCAHPCAIGPPPGPPKPAHHAPLPRKEVIQPHLPIRLPCYDFTPIIRPTVDGVAPRGVRPPGFGCGRLSWCDGRCVQGPGTDSPRHADPRLLAIPPSCRRVAACNPHYDAVCRIRSPSRGRRPLSAPL